MPTWLDELKRRKVVRVKAAARKPLRVRSGARRTVRDFLLIVAGVLTALGLESWNGARAERRLELQYLDALADDVGGHVARYEDWHAAFLGRREVTAMIWGWANGTPPATERSLSEVLLWVRFGGQIFPNLQLPDGAYHDLVNSGRLGLIRDRALREALVDYHNSKTRWIAHIEDAGSSARDEYRVSVDGAVPAHLAWAAARGEEPDGDDLDAILAEFRSRPAVRHALVTMAQSHEFRASRAALLRDQAAALLDLLEHALGAPAARRSGDAAAPGVERSVGAGS